jgi:hypothetical protein
MSCFVYHFPPNDMMEEPGVIFVKEAVSATTGRIDA